MLDHLVKNFGTAELSKIAHEVRPGCDIYARSSLQWKSRKYLEMHEQVSHGSTTRIMLTLA